MNTVAYLTTAPMGGYKSYTRGPSFVMDEWLPQHDGVLYTTIPLNVDEIVIEAGKRLNMDEATVRSRIQVLPRETVDKWTEDDGVSGPWEMDYQKLKGAHLQFDEFHHYAPRTGEVERRRLWREWIAEIRHEGATIEFLTQDIDAMDDRILRMIALRKELVNQETERDPYFHIPLGDWYELKAKLFGYWSPCIWEIEKRKVDRKWVSTGFQRRVYPKPRYYELYDSYSKPHRRQREEAQEDGEEETTEQAGSSRNKKQWERRSWPSLLRWFFARNWFSVSSRLAAFLIIMWLCFGGGGVWAIGKVMAFTKSIPAHAAGKITGDTPGEDSPPADKPTQPLAANAKTPEKPEAQRLIELNPVMLTTDFKKEGKREYHVQDLLKVVMERELLYAEIDALNDRIRILENEAAKLTMIGKRQDGNLYAVFESGRWYKIGETLEESGYYGKKIKKIDWWEGALTLHTGERVFVDRVPDDEERRSSLGTAAMEAFYPKGGGK
ncbi:MAG: zonular occludens toxin domain-containing protein [Verrucomicrobiota bacterium JB024]|nr:zonular occludens toxin domain-containing protein [Verrucomicrobiota bacterium JB024]